MKLQDRIGFLGPVIQCISALLLFRNTPVLGIYFIVGFLLNEVLNIVLKLIFKQPRPDEKNLSLFYMERNKNRLIDFNRFGMPSGHAQESLFTTTFVLLATKNVYIGLLLALLSLNTLFQRVIDKRHSVAQVIVGSVLGVVAAYLCFLSFERRKKRGSKVKKDDDSGISDSLVS